MVHNIEQIRGHQPPWWEQNLSADVEMLSPRKISKEKLQQGETDSEGSQRKVRRRPKNYWEAVTSRGSESA